MMVVVVMVIVVLLVLGILVMVTFGLVLQDANILSHSVKVLEMRALR